MYCRVAFFSRRAGIWHQGTSTCLPACPPCPGLRIARDCLPALRVSGFRRPLTRRYLLGFLSSARACTDSSGGSSISLPPPLSVGAIASAAVPTARATARSIGLPPPDDGLVCWDVVGVEAETPGVGLDTGLIKSVSTRYVLFPRALLSVSRGPCFGAGLQQCQRAALIAVQWRAGLLAQGTDRPDSPAMPSEGQSRRINLLIAPGLA